MKTRAIPVIRQLARKAATVLQAANIAYLQMKKPSEYLLFNDAVSKWNFNASTYLMVVQNKSDIYGKKRQWPILRYHPGVTEENKNPS